MRVMSVQVKTRKKGKARIMVACERGGSPRVPSEAAMMEYVLAMATGDVESRPKGGWTEYHLGEHVMPSLHGKRKGEMMGAEKAFGTGAYADAPFRYRGIEQDVLAIRWFYDTLLEKTGGGAVNPASTSTFKQLMKALSYLMGHRRVNVPKALTREIVEAVCSTVCVASTEEMTAASMLVADFVWGARAADLYLADWSELTFEVEKAAREEAARVIGLTWRRLQTKNDRQGRKDAPKPLQCMNGCDGRINVTADLRLDGIPCPVHLLMEVKVLQADDVCVPCEEVVGPWLGAYVLPVDATTGVLPGATVAAHDVAAMQERVAPTVKVISAEEEEEEGVRYDGSRMTATPAMLALDKLPKVRGTFFEVTKLASGLKPNKSYVVRPFGDAKGVTAALRQLLRKEAASAKKAGRVPARCRRSRM